MDSNDVSPTPIINLVKSDTDTNNFFHPNHVKHRHVEFYNDSLAGHGELRSDSTGIIKQLTPNHVLLNIHHDSGANRSVTNNIDILRDVQSIKPYELKGANESSGYLQCTKKGMLDLVCDDGAILSTVVYYTQDIQGTIISPTDLIMNNAEHFDVWEKHCDVKRGTGTLMFISRSGFPPASLSLTMINGLWFSQHTITSAPSSCKSDKHGVVRTLTAEATYQLWHQRLAHPGQKVLEYLHHCVNGVPDLKSKRHQFFTCTCCDKAKIRKKNRNLLPSPDKTTSRGQRFHMDFGFVRGETQSKKNKALTRMITSIDGYNSYLIIVDAHTRYTWVFLTSSKEPPLDVIQQFLNDHGLTTGERSIRTDQGGELYNSKKFHVACAFHGYKLEPTGADNSSQNGAAERPNRTLADMMRAVLYNSGMPHKFWSYALTYSVYIKNRLPHSFHSFLKTPFEAYSGRRPDISNLRVFGCPLTVRKPGKRPTKLTDHTYSGRFLEFVGTDRNVRYYDMNSNRIKIATHAYFDEAYFTSTTKPPGAEALYASGMSSDTRASQKSDHVIDINFKRLSDNATTPVLSSNGAAGSDLFSAIDRIIPPNSLRLLPTDIAVECPVGTYGRIAPRSGLTVNGNIDVLAGVVDNDFRGNVQVALYNFGNTEYSVKKGDKIAQLIFEQIQYPNFILKENLTATARGTKGFGSTDTPNPPVSTTTPTITALERDCSQLELCSNFSGPTVICDINVRGTHKTLGLNLDDTTYINRVKLLHCERSTPAAKIKKWRSTLRNAIIEKIGDTLVTSKQDVISAIATARKSSTKSLPITFITQSPVRIHPQHGTPTLYYNQIDHITKILESVSTKSNITLPDQHFDTSSITAEDIAEFDTSDPKDLFLPTAVIRAIAAKQKASVKTSDDKAKKKPKLTRKYLKSLDNWEKWKEAETTQLDLYAQQNMFSEPIPCPLDSNILRLLWAYKIKDDGRYKARCVCNGSPNQKGTVTIDHTFAACLDQPGSRIFWGVAAIEGMLVTGADASNAFAEAPAPKAPLYVWVDDQYREWWESKGNPKIPPGYVLPVRHALQGHPESPRLWAKTIDKIIQDKVHLKPTTHEPCLYHGHVNNEKVYLLRQVDDFAVAAHSQETAKQVIDIISQNLSVPMHNLGILSRFNGVDVTQAQSYIKISNKTYISKVLESYEWTADTKSPTHMTPMRDDAAYLRRLDTELGPDYLKDKEEHDKLEKSMGFRYRKLLGELLFCMVTCRPDISFAVIKLAKFANFPSTIHYLALKTVLKYLRETIDDGIYFWRKNECYVELLPKQQPPRPYHIQNPILKLQLQQFLGYVDADWAQDSSSRKSISGIVMMFAGGCIYYKTKFQPTIAHSTTEAEFAAACDAGKITLYLRSILEELGLEQHHATIIYEDNRGALLMANAGQPTRRTRHMDIKSFSLQEWVEEDLLILESIETTHNIADGFTKPLGKTLFHKHNATIMGKIPPSYYTGEFRISET